MDVPEVHDVQADAFRGDRIRGNGAVIPVPVNQRFDPVGIAEGHEAMLCNIGHDRITAADFFINLLDSLENMLRFQVFDVLLFKLLCENIEDGLHIVFGIEESFVFVEQKRFDLPVIDDVSVVGHHDPEGRIDEERLGLIATVTADRRIPGVADPDISLQTFEVLFCEDIPYEAVSFFCVETSVIGYDPCRILTPVLNGQKSLIEIIEHKVVAMDSDYSAHGLSLFRIRIPNRRHLNSVLSALMKNTRFLIAIRSNIQRHDYYTRFFLRFERTTEQKITTLRDEARG